MFKYYYGPGDNNIETRHPYPRKNTSYVFLWDSDM